MTETNQDTSTVRLELTHYGFVFGAVTVTRLADMQDGTTVTRLETIAGRVLDVYVSPKGRSVRIFEDGKEWQR